MTNLNSLDRQELVAQLDNALIQITMITDTLAYYKGPWTVPQMANLVAIASAIDKAQKEIFPLAQIPMPEQLTIPRDRAG